MTTHASTAPNASTISKTSNAGEAETSAAPQEPALGCCGPSELAACCAPSAKGACCGTAKPEAPAPAKCGCR